MFYSCISACINSIEKCAALRRVHRDGMALELVDKKFQGDPEVVKAAVENHGGALQFADEICQHNPEIVVAAVKNNKNPKNPIIRFIDRVFLNNNPDIAKLIVKYDPEALFFIQSIQLDDPKIMAELIETYKNATQANMDKYLSVDYIS